MERRVLSVKYPDHVKISQKKEMFFLKFISGDKQMNGDTKILTQ